jgi:hypothetical protein
MTKPREVELWPCDHSAACLAPWCGGRAAIPLAYFNYTHANSSVDHIAEKFLNSLLEGLR